MYVKEDLFLEIIEKLRNIIVGTEWEGKVFAVGGCIRDLLLRAPIKDIDLVVELPEGGIRFSQFLYSQGFLRSEPVMYPVYGTSMFCLKDYPGVEIEVVCTRKERYLDYGSRNPETAFGNLREDCFRRDLTINALYQNISTGRIIDLSGGINDLSRKVLRTTSDPGFIFEDDPLRMLRVIRFFGRLGEDWVLFPGIKEAITEHRGRLGILSMERVQAEFSSIMIGPRASMCLRMMRDLGVLEVLFPEIEALVGCKQGPQHIGDVFDHTLAVIDKVGPGLILRLSALLHDSGKPLCMILKNGEPKFYGHEGVSKSVSENFLRRLKYSREIIDEVGFLVSHHMVFKQSGDKIKMKKLRRYQNEWGKERTYRLLELIDADNNSHAPEYCLPGQIKKIKSLLEDLWFSYKLPITGDDIMRVKEIGPGKEVRAYLEYLRGYKFSHPQATREDLMEELRHVKKNNLIKI